jgi:hypothetical protein
MKSLRPTSFYWIFQNHKVRRTRRNNFNYTADSHIVVAINKIQFNLIGLKPITQSLIQ